ncbi:hypothetical protein ACFQY0_19790 [Haloferula chungangensis]|uniref:Uncharacterized protein n=1 Tax=Haloferula chungangensis TaxID=1048331 RepID=A0ABW2LCW9_9BACT
MGRNFKAPPIADLEQWKKVEVLYEGGIRFAGTQSPELGKFPDTLDEAEEFLTRNKDFLEAQKEWRKTLGERNATKAERLTEKRRAQKAKRKKDLS